MSKLGKPGVILAVLLALIASQIVGLRPVWNSGAHAAPALKTLAALPADNRAADAPTATATTTGAGSLSVAPSSGGPGTAVLIQSAIAAFPANTAVTVLFQDPLPTNAPVQIATGTTDVYGKLFLPNVKLPSSATPGNATIQAIASGGVTLSTVFAVATTLSVTPTTTYTNSTVLVNGEAFAPFNQVRLSLNGTAIATTPSTLTADHLGHFTTAISVPTTLALGSVNTLQATDGVHSASAVFQIGAAPAATLTATPVATITPTVTTVPPTATFLPTAPPLRTPTPVATAITGGTPVPGSQTTKAYFAEGYTGTAHTNGRATFSEVLSVLNPNPSAATVVFTYYIQGRSAPVVVTKVVQGQSVLAESVNADVGPDALVSAVVTSPQKVYAVRTITRTDPAGRRLDGSTTQPVAAPSTNWDFAEGYTGVTFQEYLTVLNPSSAAAQVTVRLAPQASTAAGAQTLTLTVPPLSRSTANIRALNAGKGSASVGMIISSSQPIVAERVEYFGDGSGSGKFGSTVTAGLPAAATQLHIGYGISGGSAADATSKVQPVGSQQFITLLNAATSGAAAHVTIRYADAAGRVLGQPTTVDVAPGTRNTVISNTAIGAAAAGPFSVSLTSTSGAIQAEAAQYFDGSPNIGKHPGIALAASSTAATDLFFADLATQLPGGASVNRNIYLYNPNTSAVQVTATYFNAGGRAAYATYTVAPGGITTVSVNHDAPLSFGSGPIGAEFKSANGLSFSAYAIGRSADNLAAFEEVGAAS